jgi:hypothetical protein
MGLILMKKLLLLLGLALVISTGCNNISSNMTQSPDMKNLMRGVMADAMKNPEVQKQMFKAMTESPEARKAMAEMLKTPEVRESFIDIIKSPELRIALRDMFNDWLRSRLIR